MCQRCRGVVHSPRNACLRAYSDDPRVRVARHACARVAADLHDNQTTFPMNATVGARGARPWSAYPQSIEGLAGAAAPLQQGHKRMHRVVYLSHIHKTGGSSLCAQAASMAHRI